MTTARNSDNDPRLPRPRSGGQELLSIPEVIAELGVPRSTFYRWRQTGVGPKAIKLPNGQSGSVGLSWKPGFAAWKVI